MQKVILADNHDVFRVGLARLLADEGDLRIVLHASDPARVNAAIAAHPASMVIVSTSLIEPLAAFVQKAREKLCRVLLIASHPESIESYRSAGVAGVITRDTPANAFIDCIRRMQRGVEFVFPHLPKATADTAGLRAASLLHASEKKVVALLMEGLKNKGIAERMGTREQVVKNKLQSIFDKTGCSTRVELALYVTHHPGFATAITQSQIPAPASQAR